MIFGWGFPLGVAQGYVDYGRWPNVVWGGRCHFPWALPKATLTMAVGQMWCVGAVPFPLGVAQGYVDYGRWPIVGGGGALISHSWFAPA